MDMKKLKERGSDGMCKTGSDTKFTWYPALGLCSSRELAPAAAFIRFEVPFVLCKEYVV